jgi:hypothetical protein
MIRYYGQRLPDGRILSVADNDDILQDGIDEFNKRQRRTLGIFIGIIIGIVIFGVAFIR